ncbi:MAG: M23 family metallopeptidase [Mycobacteriales bacterium]
MLLSRVLASMALVTPVAVVQPQPPWTAPLPAPLAVVRAFDPPDQQWLPGHRGVDLAATDGAIVRAAGSGRVSFAGQLAGRGVVVVVKAELRSTYEPVTASVRVSELVDAGDPIGALEAGHQPSRPAAAVLHWGVRRGETYLDPMSMLAGPKPVRLLPHWRGPPAAAASGHYYTPQGDRRPPSAVRQAPPARRRRPEPVRAATVLAVGLLAAAAISRGPP